MHSQQEVNAIISQLCSGLKPLFPLGSMEAILFGSYARGEETPISDVDILVQFDEGGISLLKHAAMICELEEILNRPVDIVQEKMLRPRVRESINQDKKLIYERAQ